MKAKITRGKSFGGVFRYLTQKEKEAKIIGGNVSEKEKEAKKIAKEFEEVANFRPDIEKPVWHCSLSLPVGEELTDEEWQEIADDFLREMGFSDKHPWVAIRHRDTEHDHIHIVASRVSVDGEVWLGQFEAKRAIEITQKLEEKYDLTKTTGLKKAEKTLTSGEIQMALRTGELPDRIRLQRVVDAALETGPISVSEFVESLQIAGIMIRPNIASTGRLHGFSFSFDGKVWFKGSSLGKKYSYKSLEERGLTYVESRDRPQLERLAISTVDRTANRDQKIEPDAQRDPGEAVAGLGSAVVGRGGPESTQGLGGGARGVDRGADSSLSGGISTATDRRNKVLNRRDREKTAIENQKDRGADSSVGPTVVDQNVGNNLGRDHRRDDGGPRGGSDPVVRRVREADRVQAREIDPTPYLEARGYVVRREGRHLSVRDSDGEEVYRVTRQQDGHWVWCDKYSERGGDNIDLVREIEGGVGYAEAVYRLLGGPYLSRPEPIHRRPPTMPTCTPQDARRGREYLMLRGISEEIIARAEACGMVAYCGGGVLFIGRDDRGTPQNISRRAIDPRDPTPKRDLRGSNKSYPPILPGQSRDVWIVEGGVDALAVHEICRRRETPPPTVIVSGGASTKSYLQNERVIELLKGAERVIICREREKDSDTQRRTDRAHDEQAQMITRITGRPVYTWTPPLGKKDIADLVRPPDDDRTPPPLPNRERIRTR